MDFEVGVGDWGDAFGVLAQEAGLFDLFDDFCGLEGELGADREELGDVQAHRFM